MLTLLPGYVVTCEPIATRVVLWAVRLLVGPVPTILIRSVSMVLQLP